MTASKWAGEAAMYVSVHRDAESWAGATTLHLAAAAMGDLDGAKDCVLRALGLDPQYKPARALYKKLQEAFREHAAKQKQTLKGAFAADHAITADDRVDLEPDRLPIDEDPSDGA